LRASHYKRFTNSIAAPLFFEFPAYVVNCTRPEAYVHIALYLNCLQDIGSLSIICMYNGVVLTKQATCEIFPYRAREGRGKMTLGQKVKERRLALNYTLRELAKLAEMDFTYLSKIENDKTDRPPSEDLLRRLAKQLESDADELVILSGQVPQVMKEALTRDESALRFFRSMAERGADWDDLDKLLKKLPQRK